MALVLHVAHPGLFKHVADILGQIGKTGFLNGSYPTCGTYPRLVGMTGSQCGSGPTCGSNSGLVGMAGSLNVSSATCGSYPGLVGLVDTLALVQYVAHVLV